jgi:glycosyltransferase involved in cell wall biosynthesis
MDVKISVLLPVYNAEKYIAEAVRSVLNQTFQGFELIIINDGSTDNTIDLIRSFDDRRIITVEQANAGIAAALNKGIELARGEYIARFDADDICYPHRLEQQYNFLSQNPDYVLIGSHVDYMDKDGRYLFYNEDMSHTDEEIRETIHSKCPFIHSTVCYKTSVIRELGGYDPRAHSFEDYFLWIKFIEKGKVINLDKPLISVRLNPQSISVDEKLRGNRFIKLRKQILFESKTITNRQEQELLKILERQNSPAFKEYSYHILVAKKYLWNTYHPSQARKHLWKALTYVPFSTVAYGLLVLSCTPKPFVTKIYKTYKTSFAS